MGSCPGTGQNGPRDHRSAPQTPLGTICTTEIEEGREVYISPYHHIAVPSLLYKCTHTCGIFRVICLPRSGRVRLCRFLYLTCSNMRKRERGRRSILIQHECSSPFLARSIMSHPRRSFIHLFCHKRRGNVSMLFAFPYIIYQKSTSRPPLFRIAKITGFTCAPHTLAQRRKKKSSSPPQANYRAIVHYGEEECPTLFSSSSFFSAAFFRGNPGEKGVSGGDLKKMPGGGRSRHV